MCSAPHPCCRSLGLCKSNYLACWTHSISSFSFYHAFMSRHRKCVCGARRQSSPTLKFTMLVFACAVSATINYMTAVVAFVTHQVSSSGALIIVNFTPGNQYLRNSAHSCAFTAENFRDRAAILLFSLHTSTMYFTFPILA